MKIKTQDLRGAQLDWAVAKCEGDACRRSPSMSTDSPESPCFSAGSSHEHGVPYDLLDREGNEVRPVFITDEIDPCETCDDCGRAIE